MTNVFDHLGTDQPANVFDQFDADQPVNIFDQFDDAAEPSRLLLVPDLPSFNDVQDATPPADAPLPPIGGLPTGLPMLPRNGVTAEPAPNPLANIFAPPAAPSAPNLPTIDNPMIPIAQGIVEALFQPPDDPGPFAGEGLGDLAGRRGKQFARGATEVVASAPEALAVAGARQDTRRAQEAAKFRDRRAETIAGIREKLADPNLDTETRTFLERNLADMEAGQVELQRQADAEIAPAGERPVFARGEQVREFSRETFGTPDPRDTGFWAQVAEGGGNMTGMVISSIAAGAVGGPVAGIATGAAIGASLNTSQVYKEAIDAGVDEETALRASKWATLIGTTEIIPIARALKLLPPRLRAKISGPIIGRFADIAQGAGEEAAQEFLATVANNMVAQGFYDPQRGWSDGAAQAAAVGALLGGLMGGVGTVAAGRNRFDDPNTQVARALSQLLTETPAPLTDRALRGGDASLTLATPEPPAQPPTPVALPPAPVVAAPPEEEPANVPPPEPVPAPAEGEVPAAVSERLGLPPLERTQQPEGQPRPAEATPEFVDIGEGFAIREDPLLGQRDIRTPEGEILSIAIDENGQETVSVETEGTTQPQIDALIDRAAAQIRDFNANEPQQTSLISRVKRQIVALVKSARQPGNERQSVEIGGVSDFLRNQVRNDLGIDLAGFRHTIDNFAVRHISNAHGDARVEGARGQLPITDVDFEAIPDVLTSPEAIITGAKNRRGQELIAYVGRAPDGSLLYVEEVRTGRETLSAVSLRKYPATMNVEAVASTLDPNAQGDGGNGLKITPVPADASAVETRSEPNAQQTLLDRPAAEPARPGRANKRQREPGLRDAGDGRARTPARSEGSPKEAVAKTFPKVKRAEVLDQKQPNIQTVGNASEVNRASRFDDAWIAAGIDPEEAALMPVERQFKILSDLIRNQFGMAGVEKTPRLQSIIGVEQLKDAFRNLQFMAHVLGLPASGIGLGNKLGLTLRKNATRYLGAYARNGRGAFEGAQPTDGPNIIIPGRSVSFAHEWGHALDAHLASRLSTDADFLSVFVARLTDGDLVDRANPLGDVEVNFADVMKAILGDGTSDLGSASDFVKSARNYDPSSDYWSQQHEMFARAFEAYVANRVEMAGGGREFITKGDVAYKFGADERLQKTFPKGQQRLRIFEAMDRLMAALAEREDLGTGVAAKPGEPVYSPSHWRAAYGDRQAGALRRFFREEVDSLKDTRKILATWQRQRFSSSLTEWIKSMGTYADALLSSTAGTIQAIAKRRGSDAVRQIADLIASRPGSGRAITNPIEESVTVNYRAFDNRLDKIQKTHNLKRISEDDQRLLTQILVTEGSATELPAKFATAPENIKRAAVELRMLMTDVWFYLREAKLDIGFTKNGFLPRYVNHEAVLADQKGFLEDAPKVYADAFDLLFPSAEDVASDPERFVGLAKDLAKSAHLDKAVAKRLNNLPSENAAAAIDKELAAVREAYGQERAESRLSAILFSDITEFDTQGVGDGFTKSRTLPPSEDRIMARFYDPNPFSRIQKYLMAATRRAEYVRNFGLKGETLEALLKQAREDGTTGVELDYIRKAVGTASGRSGMNVFGLPRYILQTFDFLNSLTSMVLLPKILWTQLAEPMNAAARTGSAYDSLRIPIRMIREGTSLLVKDTNVENMRDLGEALGIISAPKTDTFFMARYLGGQEINNPLARLSANFFRYSGMMSYTNASRRAAMDIVFWDLRRLSRKILSGKPGFAVVRLTDYAIPKEQHKAFAEWFMDISEKGVPDFNSIADEEFRPVFARAMQRGVFESIQEPFKTDRTAFANDPVGRIVYGLMSFAQSFQRKVIFPAFRSGKIIATGRAETGDRVSRLAAAEYLFVGLLPAAAASIAMHTFVSFLRALAFDDDDKIERLTDEGLLDKDMWQLGMLRAGYLGRLDPYANYLTNGLKYNASSLGLFVGPGPGYAAQQIDRLTTPLQPRNNPKNNKAEFRAAQGLYQGLVFPLTTMLASATPAGPAVGFGFSMGLQALSTPGARDLFAEQLVGPKDGKKRRR